MDSGSVREGKWVEGGVKIRMYCVRVELKINNNNNKKTNTCCSHIGPSFGFQHTHSHSHPSITSGIWRVLYQPWAPEHLQKTHSHKIKYILKTKSHNKIRLYLILKPDIEEKYKLRNNNKSLTIKFYWENKSLNLKQYFLPFLKYIEKLI